MQLGFEDFTALDLPKHFSSEFSGPFMSLKVNTCLNALLERVFKCFRKCSRLLCTIGLPGLGLYYKVLPTLLCWLGTWKNNRMHLESFCRCWNNTDSFMFKRCFIFCQTLFRNWCYWALTRIDKCLMILVQPPLLLQKATFQNVLILGMSVRPSWAGVAKIRPVGQTRPAN